MLGDAELGSRRRSYAAKLLPITKFGVMKIRTIRDELAPPTVPLCKSQKLVPERKVCRPFGQ